MSVKDQDTRHRKPWVRYLTTGTIVLIAGLAVLAKYWERLVNPWTRDGQVRAQVVQITPRVTGPITHLAVVDNQYVQKGELLFEIDPRTFLTALYEARARLEQTSDQVMALKRQLEAADATVRESLTQIAQVQSTIREIEARVMNDSMEYGRQKILIQTGATSEKSLIRARTNYEVSLSQKQGATASLNQVRAGIQRAQANKREAEAELGALGDQNAQVKAALAAVEQAELNLEFTRVTAPVDGYVTNLSLRLGSQVVANQPALALVDTSSYWIQGFFKETVVADIMEGDHAVVTLMSYPDTPLHGWVESIGWGISQEDGSIGHDLLPTVDPSFEWIRLAQRVPVRIKLEHPPESIKLRVGTTASVMVKKGKKQQK